MSMHWIDSGRRVLGWAWMWGMVGCGPAQGIPDPAGDTDSHGLAESSNGSADGLDTTDTEPGPESDTSTGTEPEPEPEPNVMPAGHLVEAPDGILGGMNAIADFDGDGAPEVVVMERVSPHTFEWEYHQYRLTADQTAFTAVTQSYSDYDHTSPRYAGRVDDEGPMDAIRIQNGFDSDPGIVPLLGGLTEQPLFVIEGEPLGRAVDTDHDGWIESAWSVGGGILLYEADGAGGFSVAAQLPSECSAQRVVFGDLQGDGDEDVVVVEYCGSEPVSAHSYLGDAGGFAEAQTLELPCATEATCLADIDGDDALDLLTLCFGVGLSIHRGLGDGDLAAPVLVEGEPESLTEELLCADFDGDGAREAITRAAPFDPAWSTSYALLTLVGDQLSLAEVEEFDFFVRAGGDLNNDGCDDLAGLVDGAFMAWVSDCS